MSQEQVPQMSTSLREEGEPSNTAKVGSEMDSTEIKLKPPLVSEADLARMRVQIDGVFKDSSVLPEKSGEWEDGHGEAEQGWALGKIAAYLLVYTYAMKHPWAGKMLFKDKK